MSQISDYEVDLMITSPPYPMIGMWDEIFSLQNPEIGKALKSGEGNLAFELMHQELDKVWDEVFRVLKPGGIACINIGDATRSVSGNFQLFNSHARILQHCLKIGFQSLPAIIWRKQTNAPNKFMGSGMLPPGAYVTLEHEYILILRKGQKREFKSATEKNIRQESAYFWEERNAWFSDVWTDLRGTRQKIGYKELRDRSGAYPFELAYRLINMFSVKGDVVLDPFLGTGTTTLAAIASQRNSIGLEVDQSFHPLIRERVLSSKDEANTYINERVSRHIQFVNERQEKKGPLKHENAVKGFPVVTRQERLLNLKLVDSIVEDNGVFATTYCDLNAQKASNIVKISQYL